MIRPYGESQLFPSLLHAAKVCRRLAPLSRRLVTLAPCPQSAVCCGGWWRTCLIGRFRRAAKVQVHAAGLTPAQTHTHTQACTRTRVYTNVRMLASHVSLSGTCYQNFDTETLAARPRERPFLSRIGRNFHIAVCPLSGTCFSFAFKLSSPFVF